MEKLDRSWWIPEGSMLDRVSKMDMSTMTLAELEKYSGAIRRYRDTLCAMEAYEKKYEEGFKKGKAEAMLAKGMSIEKISQLTGLSAEEIEKLM